ncbi:glycolate oxidase iron-sulfur subunit [Pseudoxanthobacter soli DSM 19599]|uniref:Glycolate oxidase iron-sulfur subunit n=1 Tax=Pseudoxanthobacter soli DSM 19599 TaxID=1123029 RepID=A0A1M7ZIX5_9HYPH|nr:glycolate oxidase subunit GlcF [Pseudoxanthobacter soli]SHO64837.1 glycolate oxidase iron-sulfur subunit [Pseudoxanthobacter soli DSM 19599]
MQTNFTADQLADPQTAASERILRACVHCGFCTATCPTYLLLGDELDSPRGRIYLIKDMLESGRPATEEVVRHVDRCLSCLSCMTTCPSGVHYTHLVDHARAHIENTYERPFTDRLLRATLAKILPYPGRFRLALMAARLARPLSGLAAAVPAVGTRLSAMLALAPKRLPRPQPRGPARPATGAKGRVAILEGCAQPVLNPGINAAARRVLVRHGIEIVTPRGEGCCGALVHHMGREHDGLAFARRNIDAWSAEIEAGGLDAILITASGCGTTIKDYGFMLREDPAYAAKAARVSALAKDVTEYLATLDLAVAPRATNPVVAYHSACSMQHGQKITDLPKTLLRKAGFTVKDVPESHICCGSAGTYNLLQPEISGRLRERKVKNIARTGADVIAAGNIGCMVQIGLGTGTPIVHTIELIDWATGGPMPEALAARAA